MDKLHRFSVNGKTYYGKEINFYFMAYLDKCGVSAENISGPAAINCYFAYCSGLTEMGAADEITQHTINNNGKLPEELINTYKTELEESGFFRSLSTVEQTAEEETEQEADQTSEETTKAKRTRKSATK